MELKHLGLGLDEVVFFYYHSKAKTTRAKSVRKGLNSVYLLQ